ncbi:hypothetical protein Pint_01749 [Pistacia integerrima]|uniref:Uncharacterized protein n=1 Tax=Pistacia integerrima TaxID=434235 RepID=A0ACC0ZRS9_9ROSI|nr:hypothetical protein Pint_01749 [Pistacia integerrima]
MGIDLIGDQMREGETSGWKDIGIVSEQNVPPFSINSIINSINLCSVAFPAEKFVVDHAYSPSNLLDSTLNDRVKLECMDSYQNGMLYVSESSDLQFHKDLEKLGNQTEFSHLNPSDASLKFSAGSELHEALGPAFLKKGIYNEMESENAEAGETMEMPEVMSSSHLTFDSGSESLLEAVVANVCQSGSDVKSDRSFCKSRQSLLTAEKMPEPSSQTKHTLDRSSEPAKNNKKRARPGENCRPRPRDRQLIQDRIKELRELVPNGSKDFFSWTTIGKGEVKNGLYHLLNIDVSPSTLVTTLSHFSTFQNSATASVLHTENVTDLWHCRLGHLSFPVLNLITDPICSIDSLLERTIKHMLFLQSITKLADRLSKCAESKEEHIKISSVSEVCSTVVLRVDILLLFLRMQQKATGIQDSSNYEQGSSWAVEVGSYLKVCSIVVENLNKNGQMVVEMLCEECSHFLEIAEVIRSLGLTILKGVTEAHGDKTWICFVVEVYVLKSIFNMQHFFTWTGKQNHAQNGCLVVSCANIAIKDYVQLTTVAGHLLGDNQIGSSVIYSETFLIFVAFGP